MKSVDLFFSSLVTCITSLPLILLILVLQQEATVPDNPPLDQAQVNKIQQMLIDHDPRQLLASDNQELRLTPDELNALITYIKNSNSNTQLDTLNVRAGLAEHSASLALSIPLNLAGLVRYVNITLNFTHVENTLTLSRVDAGALSMPSLLLAPLRSAIARQLQPQDNFRLVTALLDSIHFQSINAERMVIRLDWQEENRRQLEAQARQVFVSAREAERLIATYEQLAGFISTLPDPVTRVGLTDLLRPLFQFASMNSAGGANPVAENRAVFIVLTAYLTDLELPQLIGRDVAIANPRQLMVLIENREDLPRHVVSSAAIAASAGATMAEVLSVYKEVHDSRYRTGFSFTDIAANQAGSLLGTLASRSQTDALLFQELMKNSTTETDFLPLQGTYDGMTEAEFIERFGNRDSPAYRQRLQELTDTIIARPFYQSFARQE